MKFLYIKLNERLSFAAGFNYALLDATLNKWLVTAEQTLVGDGAGFGYNAAMFYKYNDNWLFSCEADYTH